MPVTVWDWNPTVPGSNANITGMPMNEGMQPAQVNDSVRAIMMTVAQMRTVVTPVMYGAIGDAVTDDTAAFQAMFNSGHDCYIPPAPSGAYIVTPLTISSNGQRVVMSPNAKLLMKTGSTGSVLTISGIEVQLAGGIVDGNRANSTNSTGITVTADAVIIDGVNVARCNGYGIRATDCQSLTVHDCRTQDTANTGISVQGIAVAFRGDIKVIRNSVDRSAEAAGIVGSGIELIGEASTGFVRPVVSDNSVSMISNPVSTTCRGIALTYCTYATVHGNAVTLGYSNYALVNCGDVIFSGNVGQIAVNDGLKVDTCLNFAVTGNSLAGGSSTHYGIHLLNSYRCSMSGNDIHDFSTSGIHLEGTIAITMDFISIVGNNIANCPAMITNALSGTAAFGVAVAMLANPGTYDFVNYKDSVIRGVGTGSPEAVVTAGIGSTYQRKDGGAGTSFYVKESGTGNTGWVGK